MNSVFILTGLGIFALLSEIVNLKRILFPVVILGLASSIAFSFINWGTSTSHYSDMLRFDGFALAFTGVLSVVALLWFLISKDYLTKNINITEHFALLLFALVGAVFMVSYYNMVMLFLGIETLSISLYVLAGSRMKDVFSNEAAFKYFLMGAFATGFLLFGIALVYGSTGSLNIGAIGEAVMTNNLEFPELLYAGILMIMAGLAFKISAVPFHFWAPDVYQGSPTVITAFMSTIVKIAAFSAFFRLFVTCFSSVSDKWIDVIQVITIATLLVSNITAVYQRNVKRLLAYSSIAHAGYLLITLTTMNQASSSIIFYYVAAYSIATIGAFYVLTCVAQDDEQPGIDSFNGLIKRSPFLSVVMTVCLLSLAGIPPLAGFFAKYLIFIQAFQAHHIGLVILAIITSLIGVYYYFQIIIAIFFAEGKERPITVSFYTKFLMVLLVLLSLGLGLYQG